MLLSVPLGCIDVGGGAAERLRQTPESATIRQNTSVRDSECQVLAKA